MDRRIKPGNDSGEAASRCVVRATRQNNAHANSSALPSRLDSFRYRTIFHALCSLRASSRDVAEMEQSAAPADGVRNPRSREASGPRSGGTTAAPRGASLDWERSDGFRSGNRACRPSRALETRTRNRTANQETGAWGTEKPRWSAERCPHPSKEDAARRKTGAPLGAPSPLLFMRGKKGRRRVPRRKEKGR